jgi:hypothetical protein
MKWICTFIVYCLIILSATPSFAQTDTLPLTTKDTIPPAASVNPELLAIYDAKVPKKYIIAGIKVTGNIKFDAAIVISFLVLLWVMK